ncbi:MAG: S41 family peptidase [Patescibacteria group bacterium]
MANNYENNFFQPHNTPSDFIPPKSNLNYTKRIKLHFAAKFKIYLKISYGIVILAIFIFGLLTGMGYTISLQKKSEIQNQNVSFLVELYDTVKENHWDKITDEQLTNLYRLGVEKLTGKPQILKKPERASLVNLLDDWLNNYDQTKQQELVVTLGDAILASLSPQNRSRLYSNDKQQELRNKVNSTDPTTDLYFVLGVDKNAPPDKINQIYQNKITTLKDDTSAEAQQQLSSAKRAFETIGDPLARTTYDKTGAEPTIVYKICEPDILYLKIKQIAPTTIDEFKQRLQETANDNLKALIIDLRSNFGGNIDTLPYLAGFFIGHNQYAYDYFRKGETEPHKTVTEKISSLARFRRIIVLIDKGTQSTAEVLATTLKKYNIGILIGETTGGRGTVENFFPLKTIIKDNIEYSALIVKAVTLRDDNQPIEGRGVEPNISIKDKDWQQQLTDYYNDRNLTSITAELLVSK